jgi:hypothetical protein
VQTSLASMSAQNTVSSIEWHWEIKSLPMCLIKHQVVKIKGRVEVYFLSLH